MTLSRIRNSFIILSLLVIAFGSGYRLGLNRSVNFSISDKISINGKNPPPTLSSYNFDLFWDVWERMNQGYIDKSALEPQKMIYGAISGMVSSVDDPYTVFLPPEQNKESKDDLSGRFEGIGAQLGVKDKKIVIIAPLKDSPAEKAGLKAGDWIIKVDDKETIDWTLPETVSKIRGPKGSQVKLTIVGKEASKSSDISVTRDSINVASVEWEIKNVQCSNVPMFQCKEIKELCSDCKSVVYLKLARFGDNTTEEWNKAVDEIESRIQNSEFRIRGLILDLRNNPGGYLSGSVFIGSEFIANGTIVIQENASGEKQNFSVNRKGRLTNLPLVVLINKGSASASEIVAGALKDRKKAKLVGETTFGKGSIQEAQELAGGAGIHITTAKWLLPSGKWVNGKGIEPDVLVEIDENNPDVDSQLEKALEVLVK